MEIRDTKYVTLLQESEISEGWHSKNSILGVNCCRITTLTKYPWPSG